MTAQDPPEVETLMTARDAGAVLGLSAKRVLALARERRLRHIKYGPRTIRFRPSDVYGFARARNGGDGFLDSQDAASVLGVSREAVIRAVQDGELIGSKLGGPFYRFRVEDLVAYMEAHEISEDPS